LTPLGETLPKKHH